MFSQPFLPAAVHTVHRNAANAPETLDGADQKRSDGFFIAEAANKRRP